MQSVHTLRFLALTLLGTTVWAGIIVREGMTQEVAPVPMPLPVTKTPAALFVAPVPAPCDRPLPINLPTALKLANVQNLDIALASARIQVATAQFDRAKVLWLPTLVTGGDYFRHDGQIQDVGGIVFGTSKTSLMGGVGPIMTFAITDAVFEPLAARQVVRAREATLQAAMNDAMLAVAEAYFNVQQARGELSGAIDAVRRAEEVVAKTTELEKKSGLVPPVEVSRVRTELARRRQAVPAARERWRGASADLVRVLHLEPGVVVDPVEPPSLEVSLVSPGQCVDDLIAQALTSRPELAAQQALVQAALRRLKEEKLRPLVPSVLLRGAATNPAGTLSSGVFGGGRNDRIGDASMRNSMDLQVLWELQNLGFGNRARIRERSAEREAAIIEQFRTQDLVAAQVAQAFAQVQSAAIRAGEAETELKDAIDSATQNVEGMTQTKRAGGNLILLVIRPQEAVQSVQALAQAYYDYYGAIADYNRAQFRLYRALGNPAQAMLQFPCSADAGSGEIGAVPPLPSQLPDHKVRPD
ncbi:MAG: TolC family protein [Gemmataceae bacterium]|nr:TolC family protein [Gemmataceae bacterium]